MIMRIHRISGWGRTQKHFPPIEARHVEDHEGKAEPKGHTHGQGQQELFRKHVASKKINHAAVNLELVKKKTGDASDIRLDNPTFFSYQAGYRIPVLL
jgi:hypothetical protein